MVYSKVSIEEIQFGELEEKAFFDFTTNCSPSFPRYIASLSFCKEIVLFKKEFAKEKYESSAL